MAWISGPKFPIPGAAGAEASCYTAGESGAEVYLPKNKAGPEFAAEAAA